MSGTPYGRALVHVGLSQAVAGVLKIALPIVAARILAPREFGVYSVAIVAILLIFNLGNLGLSPSITYHVAQRRHAHDVSSYNALVLAVVLGLLGMVLGGAVVLGFRDHLAHGASTGLVLCALSAVPSYYVVNAAMGFFLGMEDYRRYNALNVAFYFAVLVATLAALALSPTAGAAVGGWSAGSAIVAIVAVSMLRPRWSGHRQLDAAYWRDTTAYGAKNHVSGVVTFLNYRADVLLVAAILGPADAGIYAAAVAIGEVLWFFSQVSSWVLFARVASQGDAARRRQLTAVTSRLVLATTGAAAIIVAALASPILATVYGEEYASAANALRILLIGVVALSVSRVLANYVAALGDPARNISGSVTGLVVNVALNVVLIPELGVAGAALASAISYSVTLAHRLWVFGRLDGGARPLADCLVPRPRDLVVIRDSLSTRPLRVR